MGVREINITKEGVNIAKAKLKLLKKRQEWIEQGVYFGTDKEPYFENMMKNLEQR